MSNPLSYSSVKLEFFSKDGSRLKSASGFVVESGRQYYLITNWHVLSGRDSPASSAKESVAEPYLLKTTIRIHLHERYGEKTDLFSMGIRKKVSLRLYDDHNAPRWIERHGNQQDEPLADVVALPIQADMTLRLFSGKIPGITVTTEPWAKNTELWTRISAIPLSAIDTDVEYGPPDTVHIIGYPSGWTPEGSDRSSSAFWRTSFIASEIYEPGTVQWNTFYVDPCAPEGMTGSPVVGMKNDRLKLLGVYSDRTTAELAANAGLVWDARLVKELLAAR
ncbi:MAG TPA: hypothetical protein VFY25_01045 [Anaerolineales bacterium]|nr:hypothetical protein [Anaerolineales bacterium]